MDGSLAGLASLLGTIRGLYPQARVTSGYRGPSNPLTLRNPASMHAQGSAADPRAVDVAPIPGVSFDQYVNSVKQAGVPIRQAFDEASHPFPWTTGPNWHLATGQPQQMAPYYAPKRKPYTLADIANPNPRRGVGSIAPPVMTDMPVSLDPNQALGGAPPMSLASLAGAAQAPVAMHKPSPFNAGNIMGVLGDALMAYGGMHPQFAPMLAQQQQDERSQGFDREKWNAALEEKRQEALAKAAEPPQAAQDAIWFTKQPPEVQAQILRGRDAMYPATAFDPTKGMVRVPRSAGGPPPEAVAELRSAVAKGDHEAISEFEQTFGQGSASQYLGGY